MSKPQEPDRQDGFVDLALHARGLRGPLGRHEAAGESTSARDGMPTNESTSDTRPTSGWAWTAEPLDSKIPGPVRVAIRLAAGDEAAFAIACRLFVEDATEGCFEDSVSAARLERAVARSTLDAWARGQGSAEAVGVVYAIVVARVAQLMNITLLGDRRTQADDAHRARVRTGRAPETPPQPPSLGTMAASDEPMLQDFYEVLLSGPLEPRWVDGEVHVEVRGRSFALAGHPRGVTVRKQHAASPAETVAAICTDIDQLLSALGLGRLGKPPAREADYENWRRRDRCAQLRPARTVDSLHHVETPAATVEPGTVHATEPITIFREVYDRLLLHRIEPRWVDDELYVDIRGRAFAVAEHPRGVAVRVQAATVATVCDDLEEAIAVLGLPPGVIHSSEAAVLEVPTRLIAPLRRVRQRAPDRHSGVAPAPARKASSK